MMSRRLLPLAFAALALPALAQPAPAYLAQAVADPHRPAQDVARDSVRKPAEMLAFAGVRPGMTVVDFLPGGGYFTRIFSSAVGPRGTVYAVYPPPKADAAPGKPAIEALAGDAAYANVRPLQQSAATLRLPAQADVFWTSLNYHDLHNVPGLDLAAFNRAVFAALKPGGAYVVADHVGLAGDPQVTSTLHRIDPAVVRREVEAAGFVFDGETTALRNPADAHVLKVFDPQIRGRTDQFVYRFRKPG